jgi:hypothetical protein
MPEPYKTALIGNVSNRLKRGMGSLYLERGSWISWQSINTGVGRTCQHLLEVATSRRGTSPALRQRSPTLLHG